MTSLHPPSFHRNDFSTCSTHFSFFGAKPQLFASRARGQRPVPAAHAQMTSPSCDTEQMALCSPFLLGAPSSTVVMHREPKTIASRPCTPPSTLEMFGEKISASPGSSKEIAGLLRKMMMMMRMMMKMTRKS